MTTFTTTERRFWAEESKQENEVFQSQDDENISANFPVKFSSSRLTDREKYLLKKCWHLKKELLPNSRKSQLHLDRRTTSRWMVGPFSWCRRFNDYHSLLLPIPQLLRTTISVLIFQRLKIQGGSLDSN